MWGRRQRCRGRLPSGSAASRAREKGHGRLEFACRPQDGQSTRAGGSPEARGFRNSSAIRRRVLHRSPGEEESGRVGGLPSTDSAPAGGWGAAKRVRSVPSGRRWAPVHPHAPPPTPIRPRTRGFCPRTSGAASSRRRRAPRCRPRSGATRGSSATPRRRAPSAAPPRAAPPTRAPSARPSPPPSPRRRSPSSRASGGRNCCYRQQPATSSAMSRNQSNYDRALTIFSPEGRLYQVGASRPAPPAASAPRPPRAPRPAPPAPPAPPKGGVPSRRGAGPSAGG